MPRNTLNRDALDTLLIQLSSLIFDATGLSLDPHELVQVLNKTQGTAWDYYSSSVNDMYLTAAYALIPLKRYGLDTCTERAAEDVARATLIASRAW